jgi:murein DD-endopeptidase MepM/ murein hydrolase activator NlpD
LLSNNYSHKLRFSKLIVSGCYSGNAMSLLLLLCTSFLISCDPVFKKNPDSRMILPDTLVKARPVAPNLFCGLPLDSFNVTTGTIKPNRFLPDILKKYGITLQEIDLLVRHSTNVFDVRDIRSGRNYTILSDKDSIGKAKYFIYEHDPSVFYIFSFNDSINITPYHLTIKTEIKFASGKIDTSLWDAMIGAGLNYELTNSLSDIYAWTVDFFGLQKGDGFKVIYEEKFIGNNSMGIGKIYGAEFICSGKKIYALPLIQDGKESFYDVDGTSLRKAFLKAPLRFSRISSGFSSGRMHPILRIVRPHFGVDYAAPVGTPVYSIGDGKVISAGIENESGRIVRIRHNSVYSTAYLHLSGFANGIYPGALVKQGDVVGYVGSSGLSTGPHLDFRFYKNGYAVDPLKVDAPAVEPVLSENIEKFDKIRTVVLSLLSTFN